ncbi:TK2 [Carcinus maenas nudivirus]|uniref:TK2 n=1 Tax=Carcinus maenas nudivirus TaxID=2880837 RepID=A0AAE8Y0V6_9VIRU|nr:TK2 [Carcinus maenas nudivirus]UBZ25616.1 TK2 [Carcinus maenas nudivirus]
MNNLYDDYVSYPKDTDKEETPNTAIHTIRKTMGETYWSHNVNNLSLIEYFNEVYDTISDWEYIAIDGPSCCGKSKLISNLNPMKVNEIYNVNEGNAYNMYGEAAISYFILNDKFQKEKLTTDRSAISNIAYLMAYYVMNIMTNNCQYNRSMHSLCDEFVNFHNLKPCLEYIRAQNYNVLILLDSSFEHSAIRTNLRGVSVGSTSDIVKSLCFEYHASQTAAFAYLANFMNYPCIDLDYVRTMFDITSDDNIFEANARGFKKHFKGKAENVTKIPCEKTNISSPFMKYFHYIAIEMSNR